MDIQKVFANNVRKYRRAAKLSQEKLAELSGLHRTYIGGIEQRRVNVSLKNIGKIASALGVDPAVLFLSEEEISPTSRAEASGAGRAAAPAGATAPAELARPNGAARPFKPLTDAHDLKTASRQADPADYALCAWHDGKLTMRPIDVGYEDLTVQIVNDLILKGYRGSELAERYNDVHFEIMSFLEGGATS